MKKFSASEAGEALRIAADKSEKELRQEYPKLARWLSLARHLPSTAHIAEDMGTMLQDTEADPALNSEMARLLSKKC